MQEKKYNIELVRIVAFLLVIVVHVTNYYCRAYGKITDMQYAFSLMANTFARICVPLFFMISGMLLLGRQEPVKKSLKRTWRYFVPLLFWTGVYSLFNQFVVTKQKVVPMEELFDVPAEAHLWYLYTLIPICLAMPFMQILINNMKKQHEILFMMVGLVCMFCMFFTYGTYLEFPWFGWRGYCVYYFYVGYFLNKYKDRIRVKNWLLLVITVVSLLFSGIAGIIGSEVNGSFWSMMLSYRSPLILLAAAAFFLFMLRLSGGDVQLSDKCKKVVVTICDCSFGIYLSHIMFMNLYMEYIRPTRIRAYFAIPGMTLLIALLAFGLTYIVRKIPGGKWIS